MGWIYDLFRPIDKLRIWFATFADPIREPLRIHISNATSWVFTYWRQIPVVCNYQRQRNKFINQMWISDHRDHPPPPPHQHPKDSKPTTSCCSLSLPDTWDFIFLVFCYENIIIQNLPTLLCLVIWFVWLSREIYGKSIESHSTFIQSTRMMMVDCMWWWNHEEWQILPERLLLREQPACI